MTTLPVPHYRANLVIRLYLADSETPDPDFEPVESTGFFPTVTADLGRPELERELLELTIEGLTAVAESKTKEVV